MKKLEGKTALITGAARGIGAEFARAFVVEGARVAMADIDLPAATQMARAIAFSADKTDEEVFALEMDVRDHTSIRHSVAMAEGKLRGFDILINNAAVFDLAPIAEITRESYERLFAVNVSGTLFVMQAVAKSMMKAKRRGKIINMASQAGRRGEALVGVYCATKAAVISLTQSAGLDLIKHGINVNAIAPGVVDGEHWNQVDALFAKHENLKPGEKKAQVGAAVPFGRMGTPRDLAGMAVFLASKDSDYIVAQTYNVDGGNWMS